MFGFDTLRERRGRRLCFSFPFSIAFYVCILFFSYSFLLSLLDLSPVLTRYSFIQTHPLLPLTLSSEICLFFILAEFSLLPIIHPILTFPSLQPCLPACLSVCILARYLPLVKVCSIL